MLTAKGNPMHDDGGPAFPTHHRFDKGASAINEWTDGMTLLDYFAGQAITGLLANDERSGSPTEFALDAYLFAAAMIAEKRRRESDGKE